MPSGLVVLGVTIEDPQDIVLPCGFLIEVMETNGSVEKDWKEETNRKLVSLENLDL